MNQPFNHQPENNKIELLLPAGNWNCLRAAVENGADAVYFGVKEFNARKRAENFSVSEASKLVEYCHNNWVKAYCTLNILVKNKEIPAFLNLIKELYLAGVDAVIIQHISFLPIIKSNFPGMEVHLSTQTAITNSYFYELIKEADRIILPREYSSAEISSFITKTNLPVEIFVQGAQCFSYSGKCLFSSFLGGRSGNRGWCAQPCRRKYNGSYLLSMKDLSLIQKIPEIIKIGVSSLKIEGRLRSERYVAAAAKTYRRAIDSYYAGTFAIDSDSFKEMKLAFNREFSEGYFSTIKGGKTKENREELVSPDQPMGRGLFLGTMQENNLIRLEENLSLGDGLGIWTKDKVDGAVLRKMEKNGKEISEARAGEIVKLFIRAKAGTKIYLTSKLNPPLKISFTRNNPIIIPKRKFTKLILPEIKPTVFPNSKEELLVKVYSGKDAEEALSAGADKVFYTIFASDYSSKYAAYVPRILNDSEVEKAVSLIEKNKVREILVGDLGVYSQLKNKPGLNLYLDYSLNVFNDFDLLFFDHSYPLISPELNFQELSEFQNKNFAVLVHGRVVLMNTAYPQLPKNITDERRYLFPIRKEQTYYQILNSVELGLFDEVIKLKKIGIKSFFLDLDREVGRTIQLYKKILTGNKIIVNKKDFTKGHFERGVL